MSIHGFWYPRGSWNQIPWIPRDKRIDFWKGSENSQHNKVRRASTKKRLFFFCKRSGGKEKKQTDKLTSFLVCRIFLGKRKGFNCTIWILVRKRKKIIQWELLKLWIRLLREHNLPGFLYNARNRSLNW